MSATRPVDQGSGVPLSPPLEPHNRMGESHMYNKIDPQQNMEEDEG